MINTRNLLNALETNGSVNGLFSRGPRGNLPYFFVQNPLDSERGIRHCRAYRGVLLDYTVRGTRQFETLYEWADDCGALIDSVRYGFESADPRYRSVSIYELNNVFFPPPPPKPTIYNECEKLAGALEKMNLNMDAVYVANGNRMLNAKSLW